MRGLTAWDASGHHRTLRLTLRHGKEDTMKGTLFDAWTRRRFGLVAGGSLATLLGALSHGEADAKKRKKRRRKKRCKQPCGPCRFCQKGKCRSRSVGSACNGAGTCLLNGTCARPCDENLDCLPGCSCHSANAEGERYCGQQIMLNDCKIGSEEAPICGSTVDCPAGWHCHLPCNGHPRCLPLCAA
jgi:hypothetical protein